MQMNFSIKFWVSHEFLFQTWLFIQVFLTSPQRVPHYVKIPHNAGWDYKHFPTTEGVQTPDNTLKNISEKKCRVISFPFNLVIRFCYIK